MRKLLGMSIGVLACALAGTGTASAEVLFDQSGGEVTTSVRSDKYVNPPSPSTMDIRAGDDFDVPAGQLWTINLLNVFGEFELLDESSQTPPAPPPSQVNVRIYADEEVVTGEPPEEFIENFPGAVIYDSGVIAATGAPNYAIPLSNVPPLAPGKYWVSVQQEGAVFFDNDGDQLTRQWRWQASQLFDFPQMLIETTGALTPGCEFAQEDPWRPWSCDYEQEQQEPRGGTRGGPPLVAARMLVSGSDGIPDPSPGPGPAPVVRKTCKKKKVLKRGKCVKKRKRARRVSPGLTG
jgi:hypothetical protein